MWPFYLNVTVDSYEPFEAPRVEWSGDSRASIYSAVWVVLGTLFLGNLIIGILIDNFEKVRGDERGRGLLTDEQVHHASHTPSQPHSTPATLPLLAGLLSCLASAVLWPHSPRAPSPTRPGSLAGPAP